MSECKGMRQFWNERDRLAADLHAQGLSFAQIADELNMTRQNASKAVRRWHERKTKEAAE